MSCLIPQRPRARRPLGKQRSGVTETWFSEMSSLPGDVLTAGRCCRRTLGSNSRAPQVLKLAPTGNLTYHRPSRLLHSSAIGIRLLLGKGGLLWRVSKIRAPRPPRLAAVLAAKLSFRATPQAPMSAPGSGVSRATLPVVYSWPGRCVAQTPNDRGKTVTKPRLLKPLELPLSEKQIPQVVEILESGGKSKEAM